MPFSFPPQKRIRKRAEYLRIQKKSKKINGKYFNVFCSFGEELVPRLGIIATKKIGNAVMRNRGKRLIRETFRKHQYLLPPRLEIIVFLKQNIHTLCQSDLDKEFFLIIKKLWK